MKTLGLPPFLNSDPLGIMTITTCFVGNTFTWKLHYYYWQGGTTQPDVSHEYDTVAFTCYINKTCKQYLHWCEKLCTTRQLVLFFWIFHTNCHVKPETLKDTLPQQNLTATRSTRAAWAVRGTWKPGDLGWEGSSRWPPKNPRECPSRSLINSCFLVPLIGGR